MIANTETINETKVPTSRTIVSSVLKEFPSARYLTIFKPLAPNITGIPKKNENSVATNLEAPIKIAPRIVAPEREVPGTSASTWNNPTNNAAW